MRKWFSPSSLGYATKDTSQKTVGEGQKQQNWRQQLGSIIPVANNFQKRISDSKSYQFLQVAEG